MQRENCWRSVTDGCCIGKFDVAMNYGVKRW